MWAKGSNAWGTTVFIVGLDDAYELQDVTDNVSMQVQAIVA